MPKREGLVPWRQSLFYIPRTRKSLLVWNHHSIEETSTKQNVRKFHNGPQNLINTFDKISYPQHDIGPSNRFPLTILDPSFGFIEIFQALSEKQGAKISNAEGTVLPRYKGDATTLDVAAAIAFCASNFGINWVTRILKVSPVPASVSRKKVLLNPTFCD